MEFRGFCKATKKLLKDHFMSPQHVLLPVCLQALWCLLLKLLDRCPVARGQVSDCEPALIFKHIPDPLEVLGGHEALKLPQGDAVQRGGITIGRGYK